MNRYKERRMLLRLTKIARKSKKKAKRRYPKRTKETEELKREGKKLVNSANRVLLLP
jgi:hypothetical protein